VPELQTLMTGIVFGESPRWHDERLWFSDWGAQEIIAVDLEGKGEVIVRMPSLPFCIDWLPDGRLLIVSARDRHLLRREPDGSLVTHTDLSSLSDHPWNDIVVDGRGNAYIGNIGFNFPGGEFAPGILALVTPDGSARRRSACARLPAPAVAAALRPRSSATRTASRPHSEPPHRCSCFPPQPPP
jgi:sugar lactone lactonase YvrE